MASSTHNQTEAARAGFEIVYRTVAGKWTQVARIVCAACQNRAEIRQKLGVPVSRLKQGFQNQGWTGFGSRPLCPACSPATTQKLKDTAMLPKQKITKAAMDKMPAPTPRQVVAIADALAERLVEGRYHSGWSDHRLGDDLKLPAALVAKVREDLHGPLKGDPEVDALRGDLNAWMSIGDDLRGRLDRLEQTRA